MTLKADLLARIERLERRVDLVEQKCLRDQHIHSWRYAKTITGSEDGFAGRSVFWTWECEGADVCLLGRAATSSLANLPDHFPEELR